MDYKILGNNIRKARNSTKITQEKLAEYIDVSTVFISQIENGARKPSLETIYKLSVILKVPVDDLLKNVEPIKTIDELGEIPALLQNRSRKEIRFVTAVIKEILENMKNGEIIEK